MFRRINERQKQDEEVAAIKSAEGLVHKYGIQTPITTYEKFKEFDELLITNRQCAVDVVKIAIYSIFFWFPSNCPIKQWNE